MKVLAEIAIDTDEKMLHCAEIPGLFVFGKKCDPLALAMQQEYLRYMACFSYLPIQQADWCSIVEKAESAIEVPGQSNVFFAADADYNQETLQIAKRMLMDSAKLFELCYASFPDTAYDYYDGAPKAVWEPSTADDALLWLNNILQKSVKPFGIAWQQKVSLCVNMENALTQLWQQPAFLHNEVFETSGQRWCAGRLLRFQIEQLQQCGRRLYHLGIAAFGRKVIANSFHFDNVEYILY